MEPFFPTNNNYGPLGSVYVQDTCFQRWVSSLARHERILKIRHKRHMLADPHNRSVHTTLLRKRIAKQARIRRKVVILSRKHQTSQGLHYLTALRIMQVCSQLLSQVEISQHRTDLAPLNGIVLTLSYIHKRAHFTVHYTLGRLFPDITIIMSTCL